MERVAIIGAGAAGCFCAIEVKRRHPDCDLVVYEAGRKALAKVAVTGGGRCNFTNSFEGVISLKEVYPRGEKLMKRALKAFSNTDCMEWFRREGVDCVVQEDNCVFPKSQDAMQIVNTFERLMKRLGVRVLTQRKVEAIECDGKGGYVIDGEVYDKVVVTSGGGAVGMLSGLGLPVTQLLPSLFTFRIKDDSLTSLMGVVTEKASLAIPGTPFRSTGTLLITDWGVSGPAVLRLSSYAAVYLAGNSYRARLSVGWYEGGEEAARLWISLTSKEYGARQLSNTVPAGISSRLWKHIIARASLRPDIRWSELGVKGANRLASTMGSDVYDIDGRCRFKEEFVTCGGVELSCLNLNTLECKNFPGLYFAGEVLDVDAVTGGFNLQAAWSTAMVVARSL